MLRTALQPSTPAGEWIFQTPERQARRAGKPVLAARVPAWEHKLISNSQR